MHSRAVEPVWFEQADYPGTGGKKQDGDGIHQQFEAIAGFGPAIGVVGIVAIGIIGRVTFVIMCMKNPPALHTQPPVLQPALKMGRYIGSICNDRHGNTGGNAT